MRNGFNSLLALSVAALVVTSPGCFAFIIGAAAGAGSVAFVQGILQQNFDFSMERMRKATLAAFESLKITVTSDTASENEIKIRGQYEDGEDITVDIEKLTEKASKIKIRVGLFGDQSESQRVLDAVKKRL